MSSGQARAGKDGPWTVGRLLSWTTDYLGKRGFAKAQHNTSVLLAHALGCTRTELYMRHDEEAPDEARERFRDLVKRCGDGCPVAYLIGRKDFFSLELEVSPAVLIPR